MFTQLQKMLRSGDSVTVTIAVENDTQLRVSVFPKITGGEKGDHHKALNTPLSLVATPGELDSPAFLEALEKFTASAGALRHTLDEVETAHKAAAEAAKGKGKPSKPKQETTAVPETPEPGGDDHIEELTLE